MSQQLTLEKKIGGVMGGLAIIFPGMRLGGFLAPVESFEAAALMVGIAALGAGLGGLLMTWRDHRWLGLLAGLIAGPGGCLLTGVWAGWRDSLWTFEIAATLLVGCAPGFALYILGKRVLGRNKH
jgi:hypothetical protein